MKAVFSVLGLVLVLAIVGLIARKQIGAVAQPTISAPGMPTPAGQNVREQSQSMQQQTRQAVEAVMQQPRPQGDGQ